jgi:cytochrome c oxidase subunit 3
MTTSTPPRFASLARSDLATHLGLWVFLASELLFFGAFFLLHAALRAEHPAGFAEGARHADELIGGINTMVLLLGSYFVASSLRALRAGHRKSAAARLAATSLLACTFLVLKGIEYAHHIESGMVPGAHTAFYGSSPTPGLASYVALYWITTATHALHVLVGAAVTAVLALGCMRATIRAHHVALGGLYWHLVDVIWLVVWPLFYLLRAGT